MSHLRLITRFLFLTGFSATVVGNRYRVYGEVARFTYFPLQNRKSPNSLLMIDRWEKYMLPHQSRFRRIEEKNILTGNRVAVALDNMGIRYVKNEFIKESRRFLKDLMSTVLLTVASRSELGQQLGCFCPKKVIRRDEHSHCHLLGQFKDSWTQLG